MIINTTRLSYVLIKIQFTIHTSTVSAQLFLGLGKFSVGNSLLEYLLSFSIRDNGFIFLLQYIVFHSSSSSFISLIISQSSSPFAGRLLGSASQHFSASFLYASGVESGIFGRNPLKMSHIKLLSNCLSLKVGLPLAI